MAHRRWKDAVVNSEPVDIEAWSRNGEIVEWLICQPPRRRHHDLRVATENPVS
jgi:hypothetical protein